MIYYNYKNMTYVSIIYYSLINELKLRVKV